MRVIYAYWPTGPTVVFEVGNVLFFLEFESGDPAFETRRYTYAILIGSASS